MIRAATAINSSQLRSERLEKLPVRDVSGRDKHKSSTPHVQGKARDIIPQERLVEHAEEQRHASSRHNAGLIALIEQPLRSGEKEPEPPGRENTFSVIARRSGQKKAQRGVVSSPRQLPHSLLPTLRNGVLRVHIREAGRGGDKGC
ncbi:hypothetical protein SRHO_G00225270 [Serrasalmus rhombeus]